MQVLSRADRTDGPATPMRSTIRMLRPDKGAVATPTVRALLGQHVVEKADRAKATALARAAASADTPRARQ